MNYPSLEQVQPDVTNNPESGLSYDVLPQSAEGLVQVFEPGQPGYWSESLATQQLAPLMAVYDDVAEKHDRHRITAAFSASGALMMGMLAMAAEGVALFGALPQRGVLLVAIPSLASAAIAGDAFRKLPKGYRLERQVKAVQHAVRNNLPLDPEYR